MVRLRVCVFNVHCWVDMHGVERVADCITALRTTDSDLIMLNEVPALDDTLRSVAAALDMHLCWGAAEFAGNAILSRAPFVDGSVHNIVLEAPRAEWRGAITATVSNGFRVVCTHLDHRREVARVAQLQRVHAAVDADLIGGDFNALRLIDYSPQTLKQIEAHRVANMWEPPSSLVVSRMQALGYVDAARFAQAGSLAQYDATHDTAAIAPALARTCWAGTRIDYVWMSRALAQRVQQIDARVLHDVDVSDHVPLIVTLSAAT